MAKFTLYTRQGNVMVKLYEPKDVTEEALDELFKRFALGNAIINVFAQRAKMYLVVENDTIYHPTWYKTQSGCFDVPDEVRLVEVLTECGIDTGKGRERRARRIFEAAITGGEKAPGSIRPRGDGGEDEEGRNNGSVESREATTGRRVAIVGSREFKRLESVRKFVESLPITTVVVSGGAKGVDTVAEFAAARRGMKTMVILPDYVKYGKRAPLIRNDKIVEDCDELVAFWNGESTGTLDAMRKAKAAGKPFKCFRFPPKPKDG